MIIKASTATTNKNNIIGFAIQSVHSLTAIAFAGLASAAITMVGSVLAPYKMRDSLFAALAVGVIAIRVSKYDGVLRQSV